MTKPELPAAKSSKIPFTCAICKTIFLRYKCQDKGGRNFCSNECKNEGSRWTPDLFWEKVQKTDSCWIWTGPKSGGGYGTCTVNNKFIAAHRLSWELAHGKIDNGMCVCHTCDNKPCVNPGHLFLGTNKQNSEDAVRKGRQARGERNSRAKLSDANVLEIRFLLASGSSRKELMKRFNIASTTISHIHRNETWKHLIQT